MGTLDVSSVQKCLTKLTLLDSASPTLDLASSFVVGAAYAWAGQRERARAILRRVSNRSRREYVRALMQRAVARAN